ncbi:MAG: flagella basal body P-ring formation protein FlgA [Angustibacter sp.]
MVASLVTGRDSQDGQVTLARRLRHPSWADPRLLLGLVLVLGATIGGALVIRSADSSVQMLAATRSLSPGETLTESDLTVVRVRMSAGRDRYVTSDAPVRDRTVLRAVGPGELLAAGAVGPPDAVQLRPVAVPITSDGVDILSGGLVDVWVAEPDPDKAETFDDPRQIAAQVAVAGRTTASGPLGSATATTVRLLLPPGLLPQVIGAVNNGARVTLVPVPTAGRPGR